MSNTESGSFSGCNIFCPKNLAEHDNEPSRRSRCTLRHTRNHVLWTIGSFTYSASIILFVLQAGKRRWPLRTSIYKQLPYRYRHPSAARCMSKWQLQIILRKQGIIMLTSADLYTRRPRVWLYHYVALAISITIVNDCFFSLKRNRKCEFDARWFPGSKDFSLKKRWEIMGFVITRGFLIFTTSNVCLSFGPQLQR